MEGKINFSLDIFFNLELNITFFCSYIIFGLRRIDEKRRKKCLFRLKLKKMSKLKFFFTSLSLHSPQSKHTLRFLYICYSFMVLRHVMFKILIHNLKLTYLLYLV